MKVLKILGLGLSALIILVTMIGFLLPSQWEISRSISINAPTEKIYPYVANFKTGWKQWSLFDYEDPNIKYTFSGPSEGVGAHRSWTSKKMGDGSQTITHADPQRGVEFDLVMDQTNFILKGGLYFEPNGKMTTVTWKDVGDVGINPFYRIMGAMMDKMMGETLEKSLKTLKEKVERK